jgi:hypothetical protein
MNDGIALSSLNTAEYVKSPHTVLEREDVNNGTTIFNALSPT